MVDSARLNCGQSIYGHSVLLERLGLEQCFFNRYNGESNKQCCGMIVNKIIRSLVSGLARFRVTMPRVFSLQFAEA